MLPFPIVMVLARHICFTASEFWARSVMAPHGVRPEPLLSWWLLGSRTLRTSTTLGQRAGLRTIPLGRATGVLSTIAGLLVTALGVFVLREVLTPVQYCRGKPCCARRAAARPLRSPIERRVGLPPAERVAGCEQIHDCEHKRWEGSHESSTKCGLVRLYRCRLPS